MKGSTTFMYGRSLILVYVQKKILSRDERQLTMSIADGTDEIAEDGTQKEKLILLDSKQYENMSEKYVLKLKAKNQNHDNNNNNKNSEKNISITSCGQPQNDENHEFGKSARITRNPRNRRRQNSKCEIEEQEAMI